MRTDANPRFEASEVDNLKTVNAGRRFEMQFSDSEGRIVVVSLPVAAAVELGCMICNVSEHAPYLVGGVRTTRSSRP